MLEEFVKRIESITRNSRNETSLQIALEPLLAELVARFGISYEPAVDETLKAVGLSRVDSTRPDSLFGHVVLDYKAPYLLSNKRKFRKAREDIERYLTKITGGDVAGEGQRWAGILWDGRSLAFCHSNGASWVWSELLEVSEASLLTLIGTYRALQRKPLTASMLTIAFGKDSDVARDTIKTMCAHLEEPRHRTTMLFREWRRLFEQVSTYGLDQLPGLKDWALSVGIETKDASQILFAIHTYYALVVKLLTSELLTAVSPTETSSICEAIANAKNSVLRDLLTNVEDGAYWRKYRISNFLEGDFFSWYSTEHSKPLANCIRSVARDLLRFEPATALVKPEAIKDLLKEFYTSLVDEQIRHDLGEYYTPDWLAQRVLDRVGYSGSLKATVLDPACGSGTFLVECIARIRDQAKAKGIGGQALLDVLLKRVKGMDLNPLAVISARANFILSTADLVFTVGDDVEIPIYLADCINVPIGAEADDGLDVLQFSLDTELERYEIQIPKALVETKSLGKVLLACEDAIRQGRTKASFLSAARVLTGLKNAFDQRIEERLGKLFDVIASLEEREWDRIWCRIIKNGFSPNGFIGEVDYIVGNPPWVRWSRLPTSYRERVKWFCHHYGLVSGEGYSGGIETDISTVVLYSAVDHWLRVRGRVGLLITWTVFKSASARGFRLGALPGAGLRIDEIADLRRIQPFPDATNETSIYIGTKMASPRNAVFEEIPAETWLPSGSPRIHPLTSLGDVLDQMNLVEGIACPVSDWGSPLWTGDRRSFQESRHLRGSSVYIENAHRGTISDLARVYWVKVERYSAATNRALIRTLTEDELPRATKIDPVEGAWIEADLLHPLMRGRDLGRYSYDTEGWYQIIPNTHYENVDDEETFAEKYPCAYAYFSNYRDLLEKRSTYRRYQKHLPFYVIYCVGPYSFSEWKVTWMEQQRPSAFRCAVISDDPSSLVPNKNIVPDHKLYFADLPTAQEAHYLAGYLNSHPVRTWLGGFLHGRQIGTTIFEFMRVPKFDPASKEHRRIAAISLAAHNSRAATSDTSYLPEQQEEELTELVRQVSARSTRKKIGCALINRLAPQVGC